MGITDTIVLDDEQRESETFLPIYRLCCAMLFIAYEDIEDYDNPKSSRYIYAKTAESWIFGDSTDAPIPLSFVCTILNLRKEEIREKAKSFGLQVADKPDSQDFYAGDYNELLHVEPKKGNIVDMDGNILGEHDGIWNYTIGQRKGLGIAAAEALYVVELRNETNEVVVGFKDKTFKDRLVAFDMSWLSIANLDKEIKCQAKIRSTQQPTNVVETRTNPSFQ